MWCWVQMFWWGLTDQHPIVLHKECSFSVNNCICCNLCFRYVFGFLANMVAARFRLLLLFFLLFCPNKALVLYLRVDSLSNQFSSLQPRRRPTLSNTFVLAIPTNEVHSYHQRLEDWQLKEVREERVKNKTSCKWRSCNIKHQALALFFLQPFSSVKVQRCQCIDVLMLPAWHQRENAQSFMCMTVCFPGKFICPLPWLRLIFVATSNLDSV